MEDYYLLETFSCTLVCNEKLIIHKTSNQHPFIMRFKTKANIHAVTKKQKQKQIRQTCSLLIKSLVDLESLT